jgi:hypothetical protein
MPVPPNDMQHTLCLNMEDSSLLQESASPYDNLHKGFRRNERLNEVERTGTSGRTLAGRLVGLEFSLDKLLANIGGNLIR